MKITGKCKEAFRKWYRNGQVSSVKVNSDVSWFYSHSDSMKYGVYQDFFESENMILDIQPICDYDSNGYIKVIEYICNVIEIGKNFIDRDIEGFELLKDAREFTISKANEIYNENY
jgi:hypothetical protein